MLVMTQNRLSIVIINTIKIWIVTGITRAGHSRFTTLYQPFHQSFNQRAATGSRTNDNYQNEYFIMQYPYKPRKRL